jgi:hypothetical protein
MHYNLYFLVGGQLTYVDASGGRNSGRWRIGENGDVCLHWRASAAPVGGCFRVTIDGRDMTWERGDSKVRFMLRGAVTSRVP